MRRIPIVLVISLCLYWADAARAEWQTDWDKTLAAAKREGRVALYVSDVFYEVFQQFQKKYPEIKVVSVTGRGSQIAQRVMAERRAGRYLADLYMEGSGTLYNVFYKGRVLVNIDAPRGCRPDQMVGWETYLSRR